MDYASDALISCQRRLELQGLSNSLLLTIAYVAYADPQTPFPHIQLHFPATPPLSQAGPHLPPADRRSPHLRPAYLLPQHLYRAVPSSSSLRFRLDYRSSPISGSAMAPQWTTFAAPAAYLAWLARREGGSPEFPLA